MMYGTPMRRATTATAAAMMSSRMSACSVPAVDPTRAAGTIGGAGAAGRLEPADAGHGVLERRPGRVVVDGEHHVPQAVADAP